MEAQVVYPPAQKAVAAIVAIGQPQASELLKLLTKDELARLHSASKMMLAVSQRNLEGIVDEFEAQFTNGTGLLNSGEQINSMLKASFPPEDLTFLNREGAEVNLIPQRSAWDMLEDADDKKVAGFLLSENQQVAAYICSRLSGAKVARVLANVDRSARSDLLTRMLTVSASNSEIAIMVESEITGLFSSSNENAGNTGVEKVAAVLNEMEMANSEEILSDFGLVLGDDTLRSVKGKLFRFEDLADLEGVALAKIFDGLSTDLVTHALKGASKEICEATLSAISQRTRRIIENDLKSGAAAKPADVAAARKQVVSLVMRMASEGHIDLLKNDTLAA